MEGFLLKKARGDSTFGRKNWKKRWFVLENQKLYYYEQMNFDTGETTNLKGTATIAGCTISEIEHKKLKFCFQITNPKSKPIVLQADSKQIMDCKAIIFSMTINMSGLEQMFHFPLIFLSSIY